MVTSISNRKQSSYIPSSGSAHPTAALATAGAVAVEVLRLCGNKIKNISVSCTGMEAFIARPPVRRIATSEARRCLKPRPDTPHTRPQGRGNPPSTDLQASKGPCGKGGQDSPGLPWTRVGELRGPFRGHLNKGLGNAVAGPGTAGPGGGIRPWKKVFRNFRREKRQAGWKKKESSKNKHMGGSGPN